MVFDPVAFAYYDDEDFVNRHVELLNTLEKRYDETVNNYEYQNIIKNLLSTGGQKNEGITFS